MGCEHDYEVLEDDLNVEIANYLDGKGEIIMNVHGYAVFYCKKCLDIQKKVIE